jgi:LCP family protein required for cell wall assembly
MNGRRAKGDQGAANYNQESAQPGAFRPAYSPTSGVHVNGGHNSQSFGKKHQSQSFANQAAYAPSTVSPATVGVGAHSRDNAKYSTKHKKMGRGKKVALIVCLTLVVVLAGAGAAAALYVNSLNQEIGIDDAEEAAAVEQALTPTVSNEPFYMMIIGSDTRNDDEGQRSDTNIVARIDPASGTVTLISIPRDTAINLEGYGTQKFNAAYNYYGASGAIKAAESLLGIKISHYAEVDFDGLVDLVDAVGGVTVDVPMAIQDANAGNVTVDAGVQTLDGEHALVFARSRSYVSGDFQRSTNQRLLVEALINKIMKLPATDLPNVITKAAKCVSTDMNITDILGYAQAFQSHTPVTMYSALLPSTTADMGGVSYVVCDTQKLAKMMAVVNEGGDPSTVTSDSTVSSSAEAVAEGATSTPVYTPTD